MFGELFCVEILPKDKKDCIAGMICVTGVLKLGNEFKNEQFECSFRGW